MSRGKPPLPGTNAEAIALAHNHIIHLGDVEDSDTRVAGDRGVCFCPREALTL
jgi:hypothetical protein